MAQLGLEPMRIPLFKITQILIHEVSGEAQDFCWFWDHAFR